MGEVVSLFNATHQTERDPGLLVQLRRLGLMEWWENNVSLAEELSFDHMIALVLCPECESRLTTDTGPSYLSFLSRWSTIDNPDLSDRLHIKAFSEPSCPHDYVDFHFDCMDCIRSHYRRRTDQFHLDRSILWCQRMIGIANPTAQAFPLVYGNDMYFSHWSHLGYHQLAIIREKQGDSPEAIRLSEEAKTTGWSGDWDTRITRLRKKLAKKGKT